MKCLTFFLGLKSRYTQARGTFYEEMTKFKAGLSERPQTYRKIEVSVVSLGSCAGECSNRIWVRIWRGSIDKSFIISNQTPSKEKLLLTQWPSLKPNHIVKTWERNFPYHRRLTVLKNLRIRSSGQELIFLLTIRNHQLFSFRKWAIQLAPYGLEQPMKKLKERLKMFTLGKSFIRWHQNWFHLVDRNRTTTEEERLVLT